MLSRGLKLKSQDRIHKYPKLTTEQIRLIIGSMLGEGGIDEGSRTSSRFFECHAPNQCLYLKKKHETLKPFSCDIYVDKAYDDFFCYRFTTINHPHFKKFRNLFYEPNLRGKLIPLDFIKENWHDDILAYWFLDDGHFDEKSGCYTIANKCPKLDQLDSFLDFLSTYYRVPFSKYIEPDIYSIKIPLAFKDRFIQILLKVATEDMLYKVPPQFRREDKLEIKQIYFPGASDRINDIKNKMILGATFEELKEEYPITEGLFKRLGGEIPRYITMNHPIVNDIVGDGKKTTQDTPLDIDAIVGTLLGDGNIFRYGNDTCVFSFAHCLYQSSYVKLKYELFKSYVNRIRYLKNTTNDFYSFHVVLRSLGKFSQLYKLFYTAEVADKKNPQKYLFKDEIVSLITPRAFAFWLMDDGKKYGSGKHMFTITIGKQPYYCYKDFSRFVGLLNDSLGLNLRPREEKISYEITTTSGMVEETFNKLKEFIWPYFSYKFGVAKSECGLVYRDYTWFSNWED